MKPPLHAQRLRLPFVAVRLQALDVNQEPMPGFVASGFIRKVEEQLYLYTCWHVVTGFDRYAIDVGFTLPDRRYLEITLQAADKSHPAVEVVGGSQSLIVPLYEDDGISLPRWEQDKQHVPHALLNNVNIYVPFWHDVVRIRLPEGLAVSDMQVIDETLLFPGNAALISPGDKCLIVGYPYGYSAFGVKQPTPVALTRFVASDRIEGRHQQLLLEGIAAPGMSGAPVFVERECDLLLLGAYTGSIYPDHMLHTKEKVTALGTVANLSMHLWNALPMVHIPSEAVPSES
jgi:hypothetical protein